MKKWAGLFYLICLLCLATAGCSRLVTLPNATSKPGSTSLPATAALPTSLPATATEIPTVTLQPLPSPTPAPTSTHVPAGNVHASTNVLSLNLRSGPGTTFAIVAKAEKGAQFEVLSKAPGDNWARVKKASGQTGWVTLDFLQLDGALEDIPSQSISFARVISGKVIDLAGAPVDGIILAVSKSSDLYSNPRTEATTNSSGQFYAYLPKEYSGTWYVGQVGMACNSRVATAVCTLPGTVSPKPFTLKLAGSDPAPITFNYLPQ